MPNGQRAYADRTFCLLHFRLNEGAVFEMSMTTPFFFTMNGDLVVLARMHDGGKRYRFEEAGCVWILKTGPHQEPETAKSWAPG